MKLDFPNNVDLLIIAGTSLTVGPANQLVYETYKHVPQILINNELVGDNFDWKTKDLFLQGGCDEGFLILAKELDWLNDLNELKYLLCPNSAEKLDQMIESS